MIRYLLPRPIAVCVVTLSAAVLGGLAFRQLPVSLLPSVPVPEITVQVAYPVASARELQRTVEQPLRNQLLQVAHLDDIGSVTQDGLSVLTLRFAYGTDIRLAYLETNEKIDALLGALPREMPRPRVIRAGAGDIPVFTLNVLPQKSYGGDFLTLSEFSENVLKRRIEQLPDVALVDATGLSQPEVVVRANAGRLASLGLSEGQLADALRQANLQPGNFTVREGAYQYNVRFSSVLQRIEDVQNVLIAVGGAGNALAPAQTDPRVGYFADNVLTGQEARLPTPRRLIPLRDLAEVSLRERPLHGLYTFNGERGVGLAIIKQSDAQLLHLRRELNTLLAQFGRDYPQLRFALSQDQTELLDLSISNLISNLLTGALLTFGMLFLFMRDWRLPLLVGLVIPVSIAVTFGGFYLLGLSINIVSLAGLVLGMGEIVDSAIIILESIDEKRDEGLAVSESCISGVGDVIRPLFTSVLTNSAVFLPLLLLSGLAGALFFDQAVSVSLALGVSLLCSYTLVPVLYNLLYRHGPARQPLPPTAVSRWLDGAYARTFAAAFRFKWVVGLGILLLLAGAAWAGIHLEKRGMPAVSRQELEAVIDWNEPIPVAENSRRIGQLQAVCRPAPVYVSAFIGQQQFLLNRQLQQTDNQTLLSLRTQRGADYEPLARALMHYLTTNYPRATVAVRPARNVFEQLFGTTDPTLQLRLHNPQGQQPPTPQQVNQLQRLLARNAAPGVVAPTASPAQENQLTIRLLADQLLLYDIPEEAVLQTLRTVLNSNEITSLQGEQRFVPLVLASPPSAENWTQTPVLNRQKQAVPLRSLIEVTPAADYKLIYADKEGPFVPLDFDLPAARVAAWQTQVDNLIRRDMNGLVLPAWSGRYLRDRTYLTELLGVVGVAVALLFCILTAQFESVRQPLIVLLIVGLGLAGAVVTLYVFGNSLNVLSAIGMVVLIGLLDNDSILKIDTMNRSAGQMSLIDAIRSAGQRRLKSQIMTFLTTVLGLLPVLFGGGLGAELQQPLALVVIGGMCLGVLVSWTVIPLLYWWQAR